MKITNRTGSEERRKNLPPDAESALETHSRTAGRTCFSKFRIGEHCSRSPDAAQAQFRQPGSEVYDDESGIIDPGEVPVTSRVTGTWCMH